MNKTRKKDYFFSGTIILKPFSPMCFSFKHIILFHSWHTMIHKGPGSIKLKIIYFSSNPLLDHSPNCHEFKK